MSTPTTYRPQIETLEHRELPAAGLQAYVTGGNLYVLGTASSDYINVVQTGNQLSVVGAQIGTTKGPVSSIDAASVAKVIVYGYGGNDFINLATVKNSANIYGGDGDDIIRCGLGDTTVARENGFDTIYRPFVAGSPVVNGATATDIRQGVAPLCQTDGALAEAANQGHNFGNDIQYLGNNYYQVKLYGSLSTQKVYFDGWTNSADAVEGASGEFWMVLMQRARLQALGIDPTRQYTIAEWNAFNQKTNGKLYSISEALCNFTGAIPTYTTIAAAYPQALQASLARGDCIMVQTNSASGITNDGVIGNHAYGVVSVYYDAGVWKVRLYNPWGMDRDNGTTIDALDKSRPAANDGFITLTWAQFTNPANFKWVYVAAKR